GIDVAKATLQVYIPIKDENISIENTQKSLKALYSKLKKYYKKDIDKLVFIFEPTGSYSSLLKYFCSDKQIKAFIVNPRQSSNFAKALDNRSKSDIIDAEMLHKFHVMAKDGDIVIPVVNEAQEALSVMLGYYKLLQKERNAFSNHLEALAAKKLNNPIENKLEKKIKKLKLQEKEMIKEMKKLILSDEELYKSFECIISFKGVGDISAIALLHLFISYPNANRQEITALSGLDVIETSSGTSLHRRSRISKRGNSLYRGILFMPVLSTVCNNQYMKVFYDRLKVNGKHTTAVQIAVMRKVILITHSLYKNKQVFNNDIYEKRIGWNK
ncbi:MAG: IS110 family transposase, partial [Sulfurovaceae bacterium]|nr:IS110 family transposase [Sulfurovaceae bacterium]